MADMLTVTVSPHLRSKETVRTVMWDVVVALMPIMAASIYFFGIFALRVAILTVGTCMIVEALMQYLMGRKITIADGSAIVTGLLLTFCMPPSAPWWLCIVAGTIAIVLGKQLYGGLGHNPFNPALVSRAVLLVSWPARMTTWVLPHPGAAIGMGDIAPADAVTGATPLAENLERIPQYMDLFIGNVGGSLGETCKLAILLGAFYLLWRKHICLRIPLSFIGTVLVFTVFKGGNGPASDPLYQILSGGLFLGAFFMATDMVTCPLTKTGKIIFGIGCGLVTCLIRFYGGTPEGVCYSILFMNLLTPIIDRYTVPKKFGSPESA